MTGFEPAEIDALLADFEDDASDPADELDPSQLAGPEVTRPDDLWQLGKHRLLCGDAREASHLNRLMGSERAHMAFLDPPYNVRVRDIGGRGEVKHKNLPWPRARCRNPPSTAFSATRSRSRVAFRSTVPCILYAWIGVTSANW